VARAAQILERLAVEGEIANDWVAALRAADPGIDNKLEACLAKVAGAGPYLPDEQDGGSVIWRAFELPLARVRVLILGQDPYPDPARATGLSFSTGPRGDVPDSLANMYKELPVGAPPPKSGDLTQWTKQGVMLLNRALTLPYGKQARPRRHIRWWSPLAVATMKAIRVEAETRPIAAMLWGVPAHGMRRYLAPDVEVFASSHPSPMSVLRSAGSEPAFRGSDPFQRVNEWFGSRHVDHIDWTIVG
jgi:uracil-DNA glycosylase